MYYEIKGQPITFIEKEISIFKILNMQYVEYNYSFYYKIYLFNRLLLCIPRNMEDTYDKNCSK